MGERSGEKGKEVTPSSIVGVQTAVAATIRHHPHVHHHNREPESSPTSNVSLARAKNAEKLNAF